MCVVWVEGGRLMGSDMFPKIFCPFFLKPKFVNQIKVDIKKTENSEMSLRY